MKNRDDISKNWSNELDKLFGTHDWYDEFYTKSTKNGLFESSEVVDKTASFDTIADFYIKRLGNIFAGVDGNENAFVVALDMDPMQIKIADVIARSSDAPVVIKKRLKREKKKFLLFRL